MSTSLRFARETAVITGGGGDIGQAVAKRLASEGATIALLDINEEKLESAVQVLKQSGAKVEGFVCDVTDSHSVEKARDAVIRTFGSIELLFNNAGYQGEFKPVHQFPTADFEKVMSINVVGVFNVLKAISSHMVEQKQGAIVNTASMAGVGGVPNMAAYCSSKFAVIGLTETASKDLLPHNIRVNAVSPGLIGPAYMWTRQVELQSQAGSQYFPEDAEKTAEQMINSVPMHRYGSVEEIAGAVSFLLSDEASYISGINIRISGGGN